MTRRAPKLVPFVIAALIAAGIAYPLMLLATGAAMTPSSSNRLLSGDEPEAVEKCGTPDDPVSESFPAAEAGTVTLERSADGLRILEADAAGGWTSTVKHEGPGGYVRAVFRHDTGRVSFSAVIVDCRVRVAVTSALEADLDAAEKAATEDAAKTQTFDAAAAGTVTLELADGLIEVASVDPADGWTHKVRRGGPGRHVYVRFRGPDGRVHFHARIRDERMVVRVRSAAFVELGTPGTAPAPASVEPKPDMAETTPAEPRAVSAVAPKATEWTRTILAGPAGTVTLERDGGTLHILSADVRDGWSADIVTPGPAAEVAVVFTSERGFGYRLELMIVDGRIRVDFDLEGSSTPPPPVVTSPPEGRTFDAGTAGSMTIEPPGATLDRDDAVDPIGELRERVDGLRGDRR